VDIPLFGLGCAPFGNLLQERTDDEVHAVLEAAWAAGVRHFDTAPHYGLGLSEVRLGRFLATKPRDEFFLSTKVGRLLRKNPLWNGTDLDDQGFAVPAALRREWDVSPAGVRASLEESLQRLGLDRVDVLYLHDPEHAGVDHAAERGLESLAELRVEGLVRYIGVGSMSAESLAAGANTGLVDVLMVAGRYTLLDQSVAPAVLDACRRHDVSIVAAAVFNSGLLAAPPSRQSTFDYQRVPDDVFERAQRIAEVCGRHGVELPTAAMHYPLRDPAVCAVVVGAVTADQVRQNLHRLATPVPDALWPDLVATGLVPA
jgi:D-threo-aldose 1-dehydrogenase